ncbi:MAG: response regulator transcription factor [Gammaproteobacteria bacterium]|nr:response regulator transcription factor [Gammaproteobacteria bacterium]
MYKILIADDHPLFRDAIKSVIDEKFPGSTILETSNFNDSIQLAEENPDIDLVLLDLNMPGMEGLTGIVRMRNNHPEIPLGIISAEEDKSVVLQTVGYGAVGFITKSTPRENIAMAISQILDGQVYLPADIIRSSSAQQSGSAHKSDEDALKNIAYLTRKQLQVFERLAKGKSNKQIAYEMNIAETTVKAHVSAILHKLNVKNRIQAVLCASNIDFDQYLHHHR